MAVILSCLKNKFVFIVALLIFTFYRFLYATSTVKMKYKSISTIQSSIWWCNGKGNIGWKFLLTSLSYNDLILFRNIDNFFFILRDFLVKISKVAIVSRNVNHICNGSSGILWCIAWSKHTWPYVIKYTNVTKAVKLHNQPRK